MSLKRTPLFARHTQLGGRIIEFGGWQMPVFYTSILEEHHAVRSAAGLFDISHMGQFQVQGPSAKDFLNVLLTNDLSKLKPGLGQYTLLCAEDGGVIDDLYVFELAPQAYRLVVNASRMPDDAHWFESQWHQRFTEAQVQFTNLSDEWGGLAVQGPRVADFIDTVFPPQTANRTDNLRLTALKKNQIGRYLTGQTEILISRTGYTGEDGFEVLAPNNVLEHLWNKILNLGKPYGIRPAGLGARDTLRTEAGYPLYGHELDRNTTPLEAGLGRFVAFAKPQFIGRDRLVAQQAQGVKKTSIAFKFTEKNPPPRPGYAIRSLEPDHAIMGKVTSGTQSPSLGIGIGMGIVNRPAVQPGASIAIDIRGKLCPAVVTAKPIYRKP